MAFQAVPLTVMTELRYLLDNQEVENSLYFKFAAEPSQSDMSALSAGLLIWWQDYVRVWQVDSLQLKEIYNTPLGSATAETYSFTPTSAQYGAFQDEPEPNNVSFAVKFNTANRGKGSSGRNYALGIADAFVLQNTFTEAYVNGIVGAYNNLQNTIASEGSTGTWVHVRRTVNKVLLPQGLTYPIQAATFTDRTVDSQRRRLPGRGQ